MRSQFDILYKENHSGVFTPIIDEKHAIHADLLADSVGAGGVLAEGK